MKILFVAKHDSGDNDDEGAITHALTRLGHEVICRHENRWKRSVGNLNHIEADFCLFLKWPSISEIKILRHPKVFWYFDLVDTTDSSLINRANARQSWFKFILPHCLLGFCTDGNWVNKDKTGKLRWLMQGADERTIGQGNPEYPDTPPILFTGIIHHGNDRVQHIQELQNRYRDKFKVVGDYGAICRNRLHGRDLANLFASTRIVVAPDGPSSDNYWSNRVYLTLGLGGFLLHPLCTRLSEHYEIGKELLCYQNREMLYSLIDYYLEDDKARQSKIESGIKATVERNLYYHRCKVLIDEVSKNL